jgi:hypothetical protein
MFDCRFRETGEERLQEAHQALLMGLVPSKRSWAVERAEGKERLSGRREEAGLVEASAPCGDPVKKPYLSETTTSPRLFRAFSRRFVATSSHIVRSVRLAFHSRGRTHAT